MRQLPRTGGEREHGNPVLHLRSARLHAFRIEPDRKRIEGRESSEFVEHRRPRGRIDPVLIDDGHVRAASRDPEIVLRLQQHNDRHDLDAGINGARELAAQPRLTEPGNEQ